MSILNEFEFDTYNTAFLNALRDDQLLEVQISLQYYFNSFYRKISSPFLLKDFVGDYFHYQYQHVENKLDQPLIKFDREPNKIYSLIELNSQKSNFNVLDLQMNIKKQDIRKVILNDIEIFFNQFIGSLQQPYQELKIPKIYLYAKAHWIEIFVIGIYAKETPLSVVQFIQ